MEFINASVRFFTSGGIWMFPIFLVGAIGVAIGLERYLRLNSVERANRKIWEQLQPLLSQGEFDKARALIAADSSTVSQLLQPSLELQGAVHHREDIEVVMEEEMMTIVPQLEKRIAYTALYANLATLLGLLGTVMGLIEAFDAVANAAPAEKYYRMAADPSRGNDLSPATDMFRYRRTQWDSRSTPPATAAKPRPTARGRNGGDQSP